MWGYTTVATAFVLALVVVAVVLFGGSLFLIAPLAVVVVGLAVFLDWRRRRQVHAQSLHEAAGHDRVEFTARDRQTLSD